MPANNQGRTLERALDVLEYLSTLTQPAKLSTIAKATDLHVATAQRMLNHLATRGYINHTEAGYTLGAATLPLAWGFTSQDRLATIAYPLLTNLTHETGFTSSIFVRSGYSRVLTARVEAASPLRYQLAIGQRMSLTLGGGKVFLAYQEPESLAEFIENYEGEPLTNGFQDAKKLKEDLEKTRAQGYYLSSSERDPGTNALTLPIWDSRGELAGTINLVAHDEARSAAEIMESRAKLAEVVRLISMQL